MITSILAGSAVGLFIGYNIGVLIRFGLPCSLSYTYYLFEDVEKGRGKLFSAMMIAVFGLLIYPWMSLTTVISSWSQYLTILPFICCGCMMFVGIAPNIQQSKQIEKIHIISALVGAIAAMLWVCVVCWKLMWLIPAWGLVIGGIAHLTKTAKSSRDYWFEMVAFGSTFTAILVEMTLIYGV